MSQTIQVKRRNTGATGAPASLAAGEMAWNSVEKVMYFGDGDNGSGVATAIVKLAGTGAFLLASLLGVASGVATLGADGKLTTAQIPAALVGALVYQGVWNAATNSPALASGAGTKGQYYKVGTAGTTALDGTSNWNAGDMVVFDGTTWDKIDGPAEAVTSVAGRIGAVVLSSADLTDATAVGKSLLTAATLAAQRALLKLDARTAVADANYTMLVTDYSVQLTSVTAPRTITLPAAAGYAAGAEIQIGDSSGSCSSSNTITVGRASTDTINGSTSYTIAQAFGQLTLLSDGASKWTITAQTVPVASSVDGGTY